MVVLDDICENCNKICNTIYFQRNFEKWTSGNKNIDKFIQDAQISAHNNLKAALEWISYDRFCNVKYIAEDKFGKVYSANWIDGYMCHWNYVDQNWKRDKQNMFVILKSLNNSVALEFITEV